MNSLESQLVQSLTELERHIFAADGAATIAADFARNGNLPAASRQLPHIRAAVVQIVNVMLTVGTVRERMLSQGEVVA